MLFRIPFTNTAIGFGDFKDTGTTGKRPLAFGRWFDGWVGRDLTGYKVSTDSLFSAYRNQSDIFGCIREWRENIGAGGFQWINPEDREKEISPDVSDRLTGIFNLNQTWRQLKGRLLKDLGVAGNAYWHKTRNNGGDEIVGFQPLDPRSLALVVDKYGTVHKYIQRVRSDAVIFKPEEIIHFKLDSDPDHEAFGFSPLEPILWEARTDIEAMISNHAFFQNDARPAVQYLLDEGIDPVSENGKKLVDEILNQFKGSKNRHKSGVLSGVKEIKTFHVSQKDMEFLAGRQFITDKICAAYGVPKFMLGYTDKVNNNNAVELQKKFFKATVAPMEEMIAETINRGLFFGGDLEGKVKFEFNPQIFDEEESIEKRALAEKEKGAITLRQYKIKTGQEITSEDEQNPNFDAYVIHAGASATLLEDVGIDPIIAEETKKENGNL